MLAFIIALFAVAASAAVVAASAGISTVAAALLGVEVRMVLVNAGGQQGSGGTDSSFSGSTGLSPKYNCLLN